MLQRQYPSSEPPCVSSCKRAMTEAAARAAALQAPQLVLRSCAALLGTPVRRRLQLPLLMLCLKCSLAILAGHRHREEGLVTAYLLAL